MHCGKRGVLLDCHCLCDRLRAAGNEGEQMMETVLLGLVTVALLVYLVFALLRPEKF